MANSKEKWQSNDINSILYREGVSSLHELNNQHGQIDHFEDDDDCPLSSETEYEKMDPHFCSSVESSVLLKSTTNYLYYPKSTNPGSDRSRAHGRRNYTSDREIRKIRCIEKPPNNSRQLPGAIFELFPDTEETYIKKIIKEIQDMRDLYWKENDQAKEYRDGKTSAAPSPSWLVYSWTLDEYFKTCLPSMYYGSTYRIQILEYINNPILDNWSYGGLIFNSKQQVLAVQNHSGTWSAVKGHPRIDDDSELETALEAFLRELFEEVLITHSTTKEEITEETLDQYLDVDNCTYVEFYVDNKLGSNDRKRVIGLSIVHMKTNDLVFVVKDTKEIQDCRWLNISDIANHTPEGVYDKYYTLRPIVKYLVDHPELLQ